MLRPKIYLCGASGVGKTTLAKWIHETYGMPLLTGATANARQALGTTYEELQHNQELAERYQWEVFKQQRLLEQPFWAGGLPNDRGFVSDRSLDLIAYTAEMAGGVLRELVNSEQFQEYVAHMRLYAATFFIRPHPEVQATRDGRRDIYLTPEWVYRVDGVIHFLLLTLGIPFVPITTPIQLDRRRIVAGVIEPRCAK